MSQKRRAAPNHFDIIYDGRPLTAYPGQTIAEVLLAAGIRDFRNSPGGSPRGFFCGMGVCFECRMIVDGRPNVRTCMTPATAGCRVAHQTDYAREDDR